MQDGMYEPSDQFVIEGFWNLDLYLYRRGAELELVARSISTNYNVEHIFAQIPGTGEYEFWVKDVNAQSATWYALAWWAVAAPGGEEDPDPSNGGISNPEPSTWALLASGLVAVAVYHRRRLLRVP